jgi:hypothetical protein
MYYVVAVKKNRNGVSFSILLPLRVGVSFFFVRSRLLILGCCCFASILEPSCRAPIAAESGPETLGAPAAADFDFFRTVQSRTFESCQEDEVWGQSESGC